MPLSEDANNTDPLRFVKTGHAPLSQKALEQMRMASEQANSWAQQRLKAQEEEETEDWQSKLANWKDRRRQQMPRKSIDAGVPPHALQETPRTDTLSEKRHDKTEDAPQKSSPKITPKKVEKTRETPQKPIPGPIQASTAPKVAQPHQRPKPQPPPKPYPKPQPKPQSQPTQRVQNPPDYPPRTVAPPVIKQTEEKKNGWREEPVYGRSPPTRQWGTVWQQQVQFEENTLRSTYGGGTPQYPSVRHDTQEGKYNGNYVQSERGFVCQNDVRDDDISCASEKLYGTSSHRDTVYNSAYGSSWDADYNEADYYSRRSGYAPPPPNSRVNEPVNAVVSSGDYNSNSYDHTVTTTTSLLSEFSCEPALKETQRVGDNKWNGRTSQPPKPQDNCPPQQKQQEVPEAPDDLPLSVSGRQRCSHCRNALGHGAAMVIESLGLLYHLECFRCCVCSTPLGNGRRGTDVRVRNTKLHCCNCYSNDEAGLQLSRV